jgi:hypothetical protein
MLATPIERSDAFKLGIIDKDGNKLKDPVSSQEADSYSLLQRFVFKVQKSLMKSPDRNAKRLLTFAAAMAILKEYREDDEDNIDALLEVFMQDDDVIKQAELLESSNLISFNNFVSEDLAANNAGGGAVHGIGVGPKGEPGRDPRVMPLVRRRKKKRDAKPRN